MKFLILILFAFVLAGCDNFLGTQSNEESRASKPKPAIENKNIIWETSKDSSKESKSAPIKPENESK